MTIVFAYVSVARVMPANDNDNNWSIKRREKSRSGKSSNERSWFYTAPSYKSSRIWSIKVVETHSKFEVLGVSA